MFKLTAKIAAAATLALATIPMLALTTAAHAAPMRVTVGDLSTAAGVAAFEQRIDKVAGNVCHGLTQGVGTRMVKTDGCREAVRAEAIGKLSATQRSQIAASGVSQLAAR